MNKYFFEVYDSIPRLVPGTNEFTRKAYSLLKNFPDISQLIDIGCGKGIQTIELASISNAQTTSVNNHRYFLD
jgi:ubiquinone/menaquinone biosynthesis C-methylase UbiE